MPTLMFSPAGLVQERYGWHWGEWHWSGAQTGRWSWPEYHTSKEDTHPHQAVMTKGQTHSVCSCLVVYSPVHLPKTVYIVIFMLSMQQGFQSPPMIIIYIPSCFSRRRGEKRYIRYFICLLKKWVGYVRYIPRMVPLIHQLNSTHSTCATYL